MPSPFPGMDPYLEGPLWTTVQTQLTAEIARQFAAGCAALLALSTERFVMEMPEGVAVETSNLYPDVSVSEAGPLPFGGRRRGSPQRHSSWRR